MQVTPLIKERDFQIEIGKRLAKFVSSNKLKYHIPYMNFKWDLDIAKINNISIITQENTSMRISMYSFHLNHDITLRCTIQIHIYLFIYTMIGSRSSHDKFVQIHILIWIMALINFNIICNNPWLESIS